MQHHHRLRAKQPTGINGFKNSLPKENISNLIDILVEMTKPFDVDSLTLLQKEFTDDKLKPIEDNLKKPITDMSREALLLASLATNLDPNMKDYLKACHILALKTPGKQETGASTDPSASAKSEEVSNETLTHQRGLVIQALDESDKIKRGFKHAANALIQSLTPAEGVAV